MNRILWWYTFFPNLLPRGVALVHTFGCPFSRAPSPSDHPAQFVVWLVNDRERQNE